MEKTISTARKLFFVARPRVPLLALAVAFVLALAGCAIERKVTMSQAEKSTLAGTWLVEDIDQGGVIDFAQVTMQFDEPGRIAGSTGCNRYSGSLDTDAAAFVASEVASTRRACAPALMAQEQRFLSALDEAVRYEIRSDTWLLIYDAANRLRLKLTSSASHHSRSTKRS